MSEQTSKAKRNVKSNEQKSASKKATAGAGSRANKVNGESAVRVALGAMPAADRAIGERLHAIITANAPELAPRMWYGMPAYAKDGKIVCFFQSAAKFKTRYATLGFMHDAQLDEGAMWPTAFALKKLTSAEEKKISLLVKKAVG